MRTYIVRRIVLAALVLLGLSVLVFILLRAVPGDAASMILGTDVSADAEQRERLRDELGLNDPLPVQYFRWLGDFLQGDLGESLFTGRSVWSEIQDRVPVTVELGLWAIFFAIVVAIPLGVLSAIRQDSALDQGLRFVSILGLAIPNFWLGTMVVVFGSRWFGWIPPVGYTPIEEDPIRNLEQFVLPGAIIGLAFAASLMRISRSSMLEVLREDFVRTAWAKGLRERTVVVRHVMRNALIPVVTVFSIQLGVVVTGTVIIENIFNLPGMGRLMLDAIARRDYPLVQGIAMLIGTVIVAVNLVTDLIYAWLDPRIRYG
ncbi:MAG TPA: ABC transporter permease [Dehalococcoidia bacterium]|nr:ABC transporter permease [Dehalococcoidia bacterium]